MEIVVMGRCLSRRFLNCSSFIVVTFLPGRFARRDEGYGMLFQLDMDDNHEIQYRVQPVSSPIMAALSSSFRLASTAFRKGSKKASAACSNVIPSWYRGFSRALFSSQMNVMPCKTKRLSIVGILAKRYIQRQYTKV